MTDLWLAIAHHLCVFSLLGLLVAEFALLQPGLDGKRLARLGAVDIGYGAMAGLVIVVGVLRVMFGDKGPDAYTHNLMFWLKMASFAAVGLLSLPPTVAILRWRRAAKADAGFLVGAAEIGKVRRFFILELAVFVLIPSFAAAMARGYGS